MGKSILIVEDEQNIVDILSFNLSREGYDTLEAYDGPTGLQLALEQDPDLILLDLMLPGMDGFEVCRQVRESGSSTPIIMLTAREEETDKVLGLELGADDYITKPFSMRELLARVKANIRRMSMVPAGKGAAASTNRMELGRVTVDTDQMAVLKDGQPLQLSQREYDLIRFLAAQPGIGIGQRVEENGDLRRFLQNPGHETLSFSGMAAAVGAEKVRPVPGDG